MIDPSVIEPFYREWYDRLRRAGVDMVKVDGQSALDLFTDGAEPHALARVAAMDAYQHALQANGCASFPDGVLHCMCHSNDVLFRMFSTNAWRNSQDYMPTQTRAMQQNHLRLNATAGVFVQTVAWPDWDMFQTHGAEAELHAVSRAISGGPVYVCDKPGQQDAALLRRIACSDGSVPLFDRPARITRDRLLVDVAQEEQLLKLHNRSRARAVMGLFHCRQTGEASITDAWRIDEIPGCTDGTYACWRYGSDAVQVIRADEAQSCELPAAGWALYTVVPIGRHAAVLGLLDLYAGAAAVVDEHELSDGLLLRLQDGGRLGLYAPQAPRQVLVDGAMASCRHETSGLIVIDLTDGPHSVELRWG